ncbi:MAG: tetratricopeptide repeat protein [Terriglobales bacterium]
MKTTRIFLAALLVGAIAVMAQAPQERAPQVDPNSPAGMAQQARRLISLDKLDEAWAIAEKAMKADPKLSEAHLVGGTILDLEGKYAEARKHLQEAINTASNDRQKASARRSLAVSYFFERNAKGAEAAEKPLIDEDMAKKDYAGSADISNELGRLLLESGDYEGALKYYRMGHQAAKQADISPEQHALWDWRWENAHARIMIRQGKKAEAQKDIDEGKKALDKTSAEDQKAQAQYWPYLTGYVAYYSGDYEKAIADLKDASDKANGRDPFILALLAQAYEKTGKKDEAMDLYKKIMTMNLHNPTGAYARPIARKKLAATSS